MERRAGDERATAQRRAELQRRIGVRAKSRARAVAAASGGGAEDVTIQNIEAGLERDTTYNVLTELYEGEARGLGLSEGARASRKRGRNAKQSSYMTAAAEGLDMYNRYA
jgi:hypothetical protein